MIASSFIPSSLPMPHIRWLLPVFLSKYHSQLPTKKNTSVHLMFSICSIGRIYILNKTKATWFSAKLLQKKKREKEKSYIKVNVKPQTQVRYLACQKPSLIKLPIMSLAIWKVCDNKASTWLLTLHVSDLR